MAEADEQAPRIHGGGLPIVEVGVDRDALAHTTAVIRGSPLELLEERERLRDPETRRQRKESERQAELASRQRAAHPLTFAELRGHVIARPVRQAAVELEVYGGWLEVVDGRLVVCGPALPSPHVQPANDARELVELLVAAELAIVEAVNGKDGRVDADNLPDRPLSATGALL